MSIAATDPPRRHRLTVADYYRMGEVGILAPDARVELIEGEIFDMPPPGSLHAAAVLRLTKILVHAVGDDALVLAQNPVRLSELSEPQQGSYAQVDEPDLLEPIAIGALPGIAVDLQLLFGS